MYLKLLLQRSHASTNSSTVKENRNGHSKMMRFRRAFLFMGIPSILGATLFVVFVVVSSSSRSVITSPAAVSTRTAVRSSNEDSIRIGSPHRHPFVRPAAATRTPPSQLHGRSLFARFVESPKGTTEEPRYLVFGTSTTYGVGLERPLEEAYPYQLSAHTHNAATQSGGFTMAAACTQSIVGDDILYDVVVVEFQTWQPALSLLLQRLRQRFPHALFIFLRLWHPSQLQYKDVNGTSVDFQTYRRINGNKAMDDPELYLDILAHKEDRKSVV